MEQPTQENAEKGCDKHHLIYCSQCRHDRDVRELLSENERLHAENESLRASQQAESAGDALLPDRATFATAPKVLNNTDKAFWVLGWNECLDAAIATQQP